MHDRMSPTGAREQAMAITVYYATNRNETGTDASPSFGPHFHQKGPQYLRFGSADVEPPTAPGGDYRVVTVRLAPEQLTTPGAPQVLGSRQIFDELRNRMKTASADLILLIHGYSCDFTTALQRVAQVKQE